MFACPQWQLSLLFLVCVVQSALCDYSNCPARRVRVALASKGALCPGTKDQDPCLGLFISGGDDDTTCNTAGLSPSTTPEEGTGIGQLPDADNWKLLEVRAVYYVPRPIGAASETDVYTQEFSFLHERDLSMIKNSLQANTVRLAPWSVHSKSAHSSFLKKCKAIGLWVIPTFDFKQYVKPKFKATGDDMRRQIAEDFEEFLMQADGDEASPVLAWSVNYGLPLGETVALGPSSTDITSKELENYFELLCLIRHKHYAQEWDAKTGSFKRPLAIPLALSTRRKIADVGWYVGFSETNWGSFPDCPYSYSGDIYTPTEIGRLRPLGAFDMWIQEGMGASSTTGADALLEVVDMLNATKKPSAHSWPDLFTRTSSDKTKDGSQRCTGGTQCTYRTRKAVLAQLGFSALTPSYPDFTDKVVNSTQQLAALDRVWAGPKGLRIDDSKADRVACSSGMVIDEWMDDWDRIATLGQCESDPLSHLSSDADAQCSDTSAISHLDRGVYPEWMGINAQSSFLSFHCIDPRTSAGQWFCFTEGSCAAVIPSFFSLSGRCQTLAVEAGPLSVPVGVAMLFTAVCILAVIGVRCCYLLRETPQHAELAREHVDTRSSTDGSAQDLVGMAGEDTPGPSRLSEARSKPSCTHTITVPQEYLKEGDPLEKITIKLMWDASGKGKKKDRMRLNAPKALILLQAHTSAQETRLAKQIKAEMHEIRCIRGSLADPEPGPSDLAAAVTHIHARVMEGYLVWLQECDRSGYRLRTERMNRLAGPEHGGQASRRLSEMYVEALLLRILESLSEQILHAPEYIASFYHKVLWNKDPSTIEHSAFEIDYEALHVGLESIMEKSDIYKGGLNFDDINDCGRHGITQLRKTFRESPSLLVLIDVLSNFNPVFTIKLWIFLLAFYFHDWVYPGTTNPVSPSLGICVDSCAVVLVELLTICLGPYQRRFSWPVNRSAWLLRRLVLLAVGFIGLILGFSIKYNEEEASHYLHELAPAASVAGAWWVLRIATFFCLHQPMCSVCLPCKSCFGQRVPYIPGRPRNTQMPEKDPIAKSRIMMWMFMLGCCLLFESTLLVPLADKFYWNSFCGLACEIDSGFSLRSFVSTSCVSCSSALCLLWTMVGLTAFFDIFYMFYLGSAFVGYWMGHRRKLGNVLKTAQRQMKMNSGESRRVAGISFGGETSDNDRSDGVLMRKVFGRAWRMIWSRMVESMYEESLITDADANHLVDAASTIRWRTKDKADRMRMVWPGDKFCKLKFVPWEHRCPPPPQQESTSSVVGSSMTSSAAHPGGWGSLWGSGPCIRELRITTGRVVDQRSEDEELRFTGDMLQAEVATQDIIIDLDAPIEVQAMWFMTHEADACRGLDPVKWALYGLEESSKAWKQLIVQDDVFMPHATQWCALEGPFVAEVWQKEITQYAPRSSRLTCIELSRLPEEAGERLCFFLSSLRDIATSQDRQPAARQPTAVMRNPALKNLDAKLLNHKEGHLPSLTQIIPCYDETVINSEDMLRDSDGVNTNLGFIISMYPNEWDFFAQGLGWEPHNLYMQFVDCVGLDHKLTMEVRLWAAKRSQTVARTIVGAMKYHEALQIFPDVEGCPGMSFKDSADLILAHQTFGCKGHERGANDTAVLYLMWTYRQFPFYLVFDFDFDFSRHPIKDLVGKFLHSNYLNNQGGKKGPVTATSKDPSPKEWAKCCPKYASVLARFNPSAELSHGSFMDTEHPPYPQVLEILEVLPRAFPLVLGTDKFKTQGKAANQLGALRFAQGHYVQMMDANMGAFFGEACKVPFLLRQFQPSSIESRKHVACRILGFREVIFTEKHGATGAIMASGEWSFGTICQRFLDGLDVRMHYGHPDFIDAFWASNRGSLSKASPSINLSEDIFAGFNVRMRGERSVHRDILAWDKGREASFNAASQFFTKVSSGSVGVMRSRDLKIITERLGIIDSFSFYFASIAFYLNNWLIDISLRVYVLVFVLMTLSSKTLDDIGGLGSMLAAEWILTMGIIAMVPRLMELILEYGYSEGLLKFIPSIPGILLGYTFFNKSVSSAVQETVLTGEATYIKTGRPNANKHYTWRECYFVHCESHYNPAFEVFFLYVFYRALANQRDTAALPMFTILATLLVWLTGPILFCPQPRIASLCADLREFFSFLIDKPEVSVRNMEFRDVLIKVLRTTFEDPQATLYEYWLADALRHKSGTKTLQFARWMWHTVVFVFLVSITHSLVYGLLWYFFMLFIFHSVLMFLWRIFDRPEALLFLALFSMIGVPSLVFPLMLDDMSLGNGLFAVLLLVRALEFLKHGLLFMARCWYESGFTWTSMPSSTDEQRSKRRSAAIKDRKYDILVEYLYVNFLSYEIHLCKAFIILLLNFFMQSLMVLADMVCGLHSALVLNRNLGCQIGGNRQPYAPSKGASPPPPSNRGVAAAPILVPQASASSQGSAASPLIMES